MLIRKRLGLAEEPVLLMLMRRRMVIKIAIKMLNKATIKSEWNIKNVPDSKGYRIIHIRVPRNSSEDTFARRIPAQAQFMLKTQQMAKITAITEPFPCL